MHNFNIKFVSSESDTYVEWNQIYKFIKISLVIRENRFKKSNLIEMRFKKNYTYSFHSTSYHLMNNQS